MVTLVPKIVGIVRSRSNYFHVDHDAVLAVGSRLERCGRGGFRLVHYALNDLGALNDMGEAP